MALPQDFDAFEHLQKTFIRVFRDDVQDEFRDLGENWEPDINVSRSSLRVACTPTDNDTGTMILMRAILFYFGLRKAQDLQPPIMGHPLWDMQASRKFLPQIQLYFTQDRGEMVASQERPVTGQITFRLHNQTSESLSKSELTTYANRIKQQFNSNTEGIWYRGRNMAVYRDIENGYDFKILTDTKEHAKDLIERCLAIQNVNYNSNNLVYSVPDNASGRYPANPPQKTILGKSRKQPIQRRICQVRFRYALAWIHGLASPIPLYDKSGKYIAPLVDDFSN